MICKGDPEDDDDDGEAGKEQQQKQQHPQANGFNEKVLLALEATKTSQDKMQAIPTNGNNTSNGKSPDNNSLPPIVD